MKALPRIIRPFFKQGLTVRSTEKLVAQIQNPSKPAAVSGTAAKAAALCADRGSDIAKLALQYSIANPDMTTCVTGSANPDRVRQWADWAAQPIDQELLGEVQQILQPIHNWFYIEGRPENNDSVA